MNHQPFRDWLLSGDLLSSEQARSLQDHLAECEACSQIDSAWKEVEQIIHSSPQVDPEPGFSQRWKVHLAEFELRQQKRQGWVSIGITGVVALILIVIMVIQVRELLQNPGPLITTWLNQLDSLLSGYFIFQRLITSNTWLQPINILVGSFFLVGLICFMSVLWMTAYQKIIISRRIE